MRCSPPTSRSSSLTTATRGSFTGSPTAGPTTATCTCADIRKKAPRQPRSTWSCSTTWTGSTSSWTSSTGYRPWAPARPHCASRCPISASRPAHTPANKQRTTRRGAATCAVRGEWRHRYVIRRYGFHGLSHAYCSQRAAQMLGRPLTGLRIITCHLGAGASLAAVLDGRSVDTTMGFTPLEGLVMATRSGTVDPGLVLWLEEHEH